MSDQEKVSVKKAPWYVKLLAPFFVGAIVGFGIMALYENHSRGNNTSKVLVQKIGRLSEGSARVAMGTVDSLARIDSANAMSAASSKTIVELSDASIEKIKKKVVKEVLDTLRPRKTDPSKSPDPAPPHKSNGRPAVRL